MAIPPHTSHIVQALDSTPYAQFKKNWQSSLVDWNFYHTAKFLGKGDFFRVMWLAWTHAMTVANIQSGFRKTGIFLVNFEAIDKERFIPSSVTDSKILCSYTLPFPFKFISLVFSALIMCCVNVSFSVSKGIVLIQNLNFSLAFQHKRKMSHQPIRRTSRMKLILMMKKMRLKVRGSLRMEMTRV